MHSPGFRRTRPIDSGSLEGPGRRVERQAQAFECAYALAVGAEAGLHKQEVNRPDDLLEVEALPAC
jgi:hypothetical protein